MKLLAWLGSDPDGIRLLIAVPAAMALGVCVLLTLGAVAGRNRRSR